MSENSPNSTENPESAADVGLQEQHAENNVIPDDDDDFGDFDEASFDDFAGPEPETAKNGNVIFPSGIFDDPEKLQNELQKTIDSIIPGTPSEPTTLELNLLDGEAGVCFEALSKIPHLRPPNWTKLQIRHSLLVKLGIPIDLDELASGVSTAMSSTHAPRRRSINEKDIDWSPYKLPDAAAIEAEKKQQLLDETNTILDEIEDFNLSNTSEHFLQNSTPEVLQAKLDKMKANYDRLLELSSVWIEQLNEKRHSQEIYELVVQNMVGYSQKLRRNEIYENLSRQKQKLKSRKRTSV